MSELNNSYRIHTDVGVQDYITLNADLVQDYDTFDILSVSIGSDDTYRLHNSNYGVVVGRVIANNGFGVPNAKLSIFVEADPYDNADIASIYPFHSTGQRDHDGVRYNLLPDSKTDDCHQVVGTFPNKRYALDNDVILEVFDKYYKYTTRTNNSGDYIICGVPTGAHTLHMDLDLSDCGILSQRPRDFVYKGYTVEQFENPNMFKSGTNYDSLSQIFTQDQVVTVKPFWGNDSLGETIGITRADINVAFKFEPTCVFLGSIVSDNSSQGISKRCIPTNHMGDMDELVTGEGRIEMIRKTPGGSVEEFQVKGNELINSNGVWCYQIPMNLDYMMTDEYGNMVPTDNPEKGIPTRARVRFRMSMHDHEENVDNFFRAKVLVPHNPSDISENYDYEFGTYTKESSFRDLFWNNVYSVKSYIPRFQKRKMVGWKEEKFTGIKHCNIHGNNNPMPYNNIRIKLPLMFIVLCALIKAYIFIVSMLNTVNTWLFRIFCEMINSGAILVAIRKKLVEVVGAMRLIVLKDGLCPDLENWYFAPSSKKGKYSFTGTTERKKLKDAFERLRTEGGVNLVYDNNLLTYSINLLVRTLNTINNEDEGVESNDELSIDAENADEEKFCLTVKTDYLISCIEMALAQEYKVINFDFYNDWVNGTIYMPRWMRQIMPKLRFLWITWNKQERVKGCMDDTSIFAYTRRYTQQCTIAYKEKSVNGNEYHVYSDAKYPFRKSWFNSNVILESSIRTANKYHKKSGFRQSTIFGNKGGICHKSTTLKGQNVYYLKPCEFKGGKKVNLFATDIVLLGTLNDCDANGIPKAFKHVTSSSYIMPTNLALTNMETNGYLYAIESEGTACNGGNVISSGLSQEEAEQYYSEICNRIMSQLSQQEFALLHITAESSCEDFIFEYLELMGKPNKTDEEYELVEKIQEIFEEINTMLETGGVYNGIERVQQKLGDELYYYASEDSASTKYNYREPSDTMPITEAAGIAWNYTGPGQGEIKKEEMYYPGGHFLGLSCVNSQSNIKSCINLSRICEVGANMSQRRESVYSVDEENGRLKMRYDAPSGFISGDDIVDKDFRSMFATMNKKRLIATKINEKTGYKYYDFDSSYQMNFDGSFELFGSGGTYNQQLDVVDESETLAEYRILAAENRPNYDPEEEMNTQIKTNEQTNVDYYLFRMGLDYNDIKSSLTKQRNKFLEEENGYYYLPQYENSYYFYFGLRDGSTAIDEFNKQFFSECDIQSIKKAPGIKLYPVVRFCDGNGDIRVVLSNLETPYQRITCVSEENPDMAYVDENQLHYNQETFVIENLPLGVYTVTVVDDNDVEVSAKATIGIDMVHYEYDVVDFNSPIGINGTGVAGSEFRGGYVTVSNVSIDGFDIGNMESVVIALCDGADIIDSATVVSSNAKYVLYGKKANYPYNLKMFYKCDGKPTQSFVMEFVILEDNSDIKLMLGVDSAYHIDANSDGSFNYNFSVYWWEGDGYIAGGGSNGHVVSDSERKWLYRKVFFKENFDTLGSEPFKSNVYSNVNKIYWGSPQNTLDVKNMLCFSNDYLGIPHGYTVDDSMTYHSTYGKKYCYFNEEEEQPERGASNSGNCIKQYCAQAYDNEKAFGAYKGKKNGNAFLFTETERENYADGYGCVFKPIPHGNLVFLKYSETNDYGNLLDEYEKGVFYPTLIYPVMKRPFFADTVLVKWDGYKFNPNASSLSFSLWEEGGIIESKIHNGVTYQGRFGVVSVNGKEIDDYELMHDLSGLTLTESKDRILFIDNNNENMPQSATSLHLVVEEGRPEAAGDYPINTIDIDSDKRFATKMYYIADNVTNGEKLVDYYTEGYSDVGINYYIIKAPKNNFDLVTQLDEYYYYADSTPGLTEYENETRYWYKCYVLCEYKYGNIDEVRTMRLDIILVPHEMPGDNDEAVCILYYDANMHQTVHIDWEGTIEDTVKAFLDYIQTLPSTFIWGRIKPVKKFEINRAPILPATGETFYNYFVRLQQRGYLVNKRYLENHDFVYNKDNDILLGIGVYDDGSEMGNNKVYKIYNLISRNYSNIGNPEWEFYFKNNDSNDGNVYYENCSSTFELPLTVVVENDCELSFAKDQLATWAVLTYTNGDPINTNISCTAGQEFDFIVKCHYNEGAVRNTSISVSTVGGSVTKTINLTQTAAPNGFLMNIWCSAYTTYIGGTTAHGLSMSASCVDSDVVKVSIVFGRYESNYYEGNSTDYINAEHVFDSEHTIWNITDITLSPPNGILDARLWFESVEITELWSCKKLLIHGI